LLAGNIFWCCFVKQNRGDELIGKEVIRMKNMKLVVSVLFLSGTLGWAMTSQGADGVIEKDVLTPGSYCHMKFPAVSAGTLSGSRPALKDASSGDVIDFYGPCNHDPLGKDEVARQRLENQRLRTREYAD
jgi:hypothetical protein